MHYCINTIMKINEIISEDAEAGSTMSGNIASVASTMSSTLIKRPTKSNKAFKGFREYKLDKKA